MWLVGVGGICGCRFKEIYRFSHIYYLSLLLLYLSFFAAASLLFCSFLKMFFVLVPVLFLNYILGIKFFFHAV